MQKINFNGQILKTLNLDSSSEPDLCMSFSALGFL